MMTAAPPTRVVTLTQASSVRINRQKEMWRGQIMLAVPHLMAGMGGVGKSTFTGHIAGQVTRGTLEGDLYGKPANVMILNTEDSPAMVKARMLAAGADLDRVLIVSTKFCDELGELTETTPKLRQDVEQLEALMLEHNVMLLVADPLATVIDGDTNTGTDVRATIDPMIRLAHNTGATVLIVSHFNKGSGSASNKISGSHAIRDAVRGAHVFAKDEDEGVTVMTLDKNNYSQEVGKSQAFKLETRTVPTDDGEEMEVPVVVMLGDTDTSVTDLINRNIGSDDHEDRNAAQAFVVDFLLGQPGYEANAADVLKAGRQAGFNELEIKNARRRCKSPKIASDKSGFGSGWVWMIAPEDSEGVTKVPKVSPPVSLTPSTPSVTPSKTTERAPAAPTAEIDTPFDIFAELQGSK